MTYPSWCFNKVLNYPGAISMKNSKDVSMPTFRFLSKNTSKKYVAMKGANIMFMHPANRNRLRKLHQF